MEREWPNARKKLKRLDTRWFASAPLIKTHENGLPNVNREQMELAQDFMEVLIQIAISTLEAYENGNISCEPDYSCPACQLKDHFQTLEEKESRLKSVHEKCST
jgi:hypothetical protein